MKMKGLSTLMLFVIIMLCSALPSSALQVFDFTLVNSSTDTDIGPLADGDFIDLFVVGPNLNVRANTDAVGSVVFQLTGAESQNRTDGTTPYSLQGDGSGDYHDWTPTVGSYTLTCTPYQYGGGTGTAGTPLVINFTVGSSVSGTCGSTASGTGDYLETGGLLIMETEGFDAPCDWFSRNDIAGATGDGYLEWKFGDNSTSISSAGTGTITYTFNITQTGRYHVEVRSASPSSNDHNDMWMRFPINGAIKVQGSDEGSLGTGWFKVYQNVSGDAWTWQTKTVDFDAHQIYTEFTSPGVYTMEISGRSTQFKIDRVSLYHSTVSSTVANDPSTPASPRSGDVCNIPANLTSTVISPTMATLSWDPVSDAIVYNLKGRVNGGPWKNFHFTTNSRTFNVLSPGNVYEWAVRSGCATDTSDLSDLQSFMTGALKTASVKNDLSIYPNPAVNGAEFVIENASANATTDELTIRVIDMQGRIVRNLQVQSAVQISISTKGINPGNYLINIWSNNGDRHSLPLIIAD